MSGEQTVMLEIECCPFCGEAVDESMNMVILEVQMYPYLAVLIPVHHACAVMDGNSVPCEECMAAEKEGRKHEH